MDKIFKNIISVIKLEKGFFSRLKEDMPVLRESITVIVLYTLASGAASVPEGLFSFFAAAPSALIVWMLWLLLLYQYLTRFWKIDPASSGSVKFLRISGYAASAGILKIAGIYRPLHLPVEIIVSVLMILAMAQAVDETMGTGERKKVVIICAAAFAASVLLIRAAALIIA